MKIVGQNFLSDLGWKLEKVCEHHPKSKLISCTTFIEHRHITKVFNGSAFWTIRCKGSAYFCVFQLAVEAKMQKIYPIPILNFVPETSSSNTIWILPLLNILAWSKDKDFWGTRQHILCFATLSFSSLTIRMVGFGLEQCVRADLKEEPCQYEAIFSLNKKPGTAPLTKATNIASDFTKCKCAFWVIFCKIFFGYLSICQSQ